MLKLTKFIPKTIKIGKNNRKCKIHFNTFEIPWTNQRLAKNEMVIWYETKTPTEGRDIHYLVLPKFIKEDDLLYESIGLYLAEGGLSLYQSISFSNDEPRVINIFMECFKKHFKISFSNWTWSICFNDKLRKNENKKETRQRETASINFWLRKTKIEPELVSKTPYRYSNKNSKGKLSSKKKWGSLNLIYGNKILKNLWLKIIAGLIEKVLNEKNKSKVASILRGWIAGDGYCRYQIYEKVRRGLGIACGDKKKIKILAQLFNILEIKPNIEKESLGIIKGEYLVKAYNLRLTSLHLPKHLNLLKGLTSYRRVPLGVERLNLKKLKKEIVQTEKKLKKEKDLFEKLKNKEPLKKGEQINWQFLINGLMLKEKGNYKKLMKKIGCPKTVLINWLKKGVKPSRKYKTKILEEMENYNKEKLIRFGKFFLKGNWPSLLEGLEIFLKVSRKEMAKKLKVHVNTLEAIINQRDKIGKKVASKVINLLEENRKTPEEILQIFLESKNINWPDRIKRILIENEWSQQKLAKKLECSRSLVREWLGGLEPTNQYKGKLLKIPHYKGKIRSKFNEIIRKSLKISTLSELKERLNVSIETIRNWRNICRIQPRHLKKLLSLKD